MEGAPLDSATRPLCVQSPKARLPQLLHQTILQNLLQEVTGNKRISLPEIHETNVARRNVVLNNFEKIKKEVGTKGENYYLSSE